MKPVAAHRATRNTLLVGSIPAADTHDAVDLALTELGTR